MAEAWLYSDKEGVRYMGPILTVWWRRRFLERVEAREGIDREARKVKP